MKKGVIKKVTKSFNKKLDMTYPTHLKSLEL